MVKKIIEIIANNPLLLLFLITALSYPLSKLRFKGVSLGISAVLFTGIAFGSLDTRLQLPEIIYVLGLTLFVYSIGLSSGHTFLASMRRHGLRDNSYAIIILLCGVGIAFAASWIGRIPASITAGMYAGSMTNTPALAGVLETLKSRVSVSDMASNGALHLTEPVVGYTIAYPLGVIGVILALSLARRLWDIDYKQEAKSLKKIGGVNEVFYTRSINVVKGEVTGIPLDKFLHKHGLDIIPGRLKRGLVYSLAVSDVKLQEGDIVAVTGSLEDIEKATQLIGYPSENQLEMDSSQYDHRRIFVSNKQIQGRTIGELNIFEKFGAKISRLRRGDVDMIVHEDTILEPGDRVRVIAPRERMFEISRFFGDSYREASEMDLLTFSLGLTAGILLGMIPIPLYFAQIKLGFAGGPLIVGLLLGALEHTGKLVWNLPYSSHISLRQIGLVLFLAGIGTRAGSGFSEVFMQGNAIAIIAGGISITSATAFLGLWVGYRVFKIPFSLLSGMLAGIVTQPAVLAYALEESGNDLPNIGYASVYPLSTIFKILAAQFILLI